VGISVRRSCPYNAFNSFFTDSLSYSVESAVGFLRNDFVSSVSHARIYDAFTTFVGCLWTHPARHGYAIYPQFYCIRCVDILGGVSSNGMEEQC